MTSNEWLVMSDRIILSGMTFYGFHGVGLEERRLGQRFVVDLVLEVDLASAGKSDDLKDTVSYADAFAMTRDVVEGPPRNLIEAVAEGIASVLLAQTRASAVIVRVTKPWAPVVGMTAGHAAIEIRRVRER